MKDAMFKIAHTLYSYFYTKAVKCNMTVYRIVDQRNRIGKDSIRSKFYTHVAFIYLKIEEIYIVCARTCIDIELKIIK